MKIKKTNTKELANIMALSTKNGMFEMFRKSLRDDEIKLDCQEVSEKIFGGLLLITEDMKNALEDESFAKMYKECLLDLLTVQVNDED